MVIRVPGGAENGGGSICGPGYPTPFGCMATEFGGRCGDLNFGTWEAWIGDDGAI